MASALVWLEGALEGLLLGRKTPSVFPALVLPTCGKPTKTLSNQRTKRHRLKKLLKLVQFRSLFSASPPSACRRFHSSNVPVGAGGVLARFCAPMYSLISDKICWVLSEVCCVLATIFPNIIKRRIAEIRKSIPTIIPTMASAVTIEIHCSSHLAYGKHRVSRSYPGMVLYYGGAG